MHAFCYVGEWNPMSRCDYLEGMKGSERSLWAGDTGEQKYMIQIPAMYVNEARSSPMRWI